jgi:hypothetical protein
LTLSRPNPAKETGIGLPKCAQRGWYNTKTALLDKKKRGKAGHFQRLSAESRYGGKRSGGWNSAAIYCRRQS